MRFALTIFAAFLIFGHAGSLGAETRTVPESRSQVQLSFAPVVKHVAPAVVNVYGARADKRQRNANTDEFFRRFFGDGTPGVPEDRGQRSLGSGVIVDGSGLVVH